MDISQVGGSGYSMPQQNAGQAMTADQKTSAQEILDSYDTSSMDQESMEAMKSELQAAGIQPSRELGTMMDDAGFERPDGPPPGGGPGGPGGAEGAGGSSELYDTLLEALEEEEDDEEASKISELLESIKGKSSEEIKGILYDDEA